jgi:hypothetical protein
MFRRHLLPGSNVKQYTGLLITASMSYSSTLKMEVASFSETSINLYHSIRRHVPEDSGPCSITVRNTE